MNLTERTNIVKQLARNLGFDFCGIAKAQRLDDDARRLEKWLQQGMHGTMQYMENYFELRIDPANLVPGAKSVITLLLNYFPAKHQNTTSPKIAKYAYGMDYHEVIKNKLRDFLKEIKENVGNVEGRGFVDSAPVLERTWANKSGLGWIGRNGNLINKEIGSFFFIATLIVDMEFEYDDPFSKDYCGSCTRCIDACPTNAIHPDKIVEASKCISYFTIELKEQVIPEEMKGKFNDWMFGCDICQDVCPWNRFSKPASEINFTAIPEVLNFSVNDWEELSEEAFKKIFSNSPLKRSKWSGIKRNLKFISP